MKNMDDIVLPGTCRASPSLFLSKWLAPFRTDFFIAVRETPRMALLGRSPDKYPVGAAFFDNTGPVFRPAGSYPFTAAR
jgi:hypothetical protein